MYLLLSIALSIILLFILFMIIPSELMIIISLGAILGCLFRGLYLLNDISKRLLKVIPKKDKAQEALDKYLEEKENTNRS